MRARTAVERGVPSALRALLAAPLAALVVAAALALVVAALATLAAAPLVSCAHSEAGDSASARMAVQVKGAVGEYSWEELSGISAEIASAADDEAALDVAKRYRLVSEEGALDGSQAKDVALADGSKTRAVIVGFNHDSRPGGEKAGITFVFADAVALRGMNNNAGYDRTSKADDFDALGGWNASELRAWLNGEFARSLPVDLQAAIVDVVKSSVVVPENEVVLGDDGTLLSPAGSLIGEGVDALWIPALVELTGVEGDSPTARECPEWTAPLRAEGAQYQLFADSGVSEGASNDVLRRSPVGDADCRGWWLRSVEGATFAEVLADGSIDRRDKTPIASDPQGIVPCFSI